GSGWWGSAAFPWCPGKGEEPELAHSSSSAMVSPLTRATSTGDGLKVTTLRGVIGASTPVLGLRPTRPRFERILKPPKDRGFTGSPPSSASHSVSTVITASIARPVSLVPPIARPARHYQEPARRA